MAKLTSIPAVLLLGSVLSAAYLVAFGEMIMYDAALVPEHCVKARAIESNYTPRGEVVNLPIQLEVYETANKNSTRMLIAVYDIFGFTDNIKQVADKLAEESGGFRVAMPDFFRGQTWSYPSTAEELQAWVKQAADWETTVRTDLINVINWYKAREGVTQFAIYGMCWGGKISTLASNELGDYLNAAAIVHPASVTTNEAVDVKVPMYLMPSMNEPDMLPFYEILQAKFGNNTGHRRFDDMNHGFAGARGNFSDPLNVERVEEVITTLGAFFDRNMPVRK